MRRDLAEGLESHRQRACARLHKRSHVCCLDHCLLFRSAAIGQAINQSWLRTLNRVLADVRVPDVVVWRTHEFTRSCGDLAQTPAGPLWPVTEAAANLLTSPDRHYIRECEEGACRWLFLDRSKNHSRRWCDMRVCGNRSKARRFQARLRVNV